MFSDHPPVWLTFLWALWALQAGYCLVNVLRFRDRMVRQLRQMEATKRPFKARALLIVPVKGIDPQLREHVAGLLNQRYPHYRIVFVVESENDPAWGAIRAVIAAEGVAPGMTGSKVIVAGLAESGGQKVHNLLVAMRDVTETDDLLVFADADAVPGPDWLRGMALLTLTPGYGAATGYRWFVPEAGGLACHLASVMNSSIATMLGPSRRNYAWGGSMSITRKTAEECDLVGHWRGALSDDYQLTRAVGSLGRRIFFVPRALTASASHFTWKTLLEFGRRQYIITRIHAPIMWTLILIVLGLYAAGWASALAALAMGQGWALLPIAAVMLLDISRGLVRSSVARRLWPAEVAVKLHAARLLDIFATPLWMTLNLALLLSSAWGRRIRWAGITYEMRGRQDVRIVERQ